MKRERLSIASHPPLIIRSFTTSPLRRRVRQSRLCRVARATLHRISSATEKPIIQHITTSPTGASIATLSCSGSDFRSHIIRHWFSNRSTHILFADSCISSDTNCPVVVDFRRKLLTDAWSATVSCNRGEFRSCSCRSSSTGFQTHESWNRRNCLKSKIIATSAQTPKNQH